MTTEQAIRTIMEHRGMRFMDVAMKMGIATNTLAGRLKSKNISTDKLMEVLDVLGYGIVLAPDGTELDDCEYRID